MKMSEIRERYLSLQISHPEAWALLLADGDGPASAEERLSQWAKEEWGRSVKEGLKSACRRSTAYVTLHGRQYRVTVEEE